MWTKDDYLNRYLEISPEVIDAIEVGKPIVALESTLICHGLPYPENVDVAHGIESVIRGEKVIPATVALLKGKIKIGLTESQIQYLGKNGSQIAKASRRDIPHILSRGMDGATTVASTMFLSYLANIRIFSTGGIGGVHREGEKTFDISADLQELAKTDVAVVCSGAKSILDIGLTREYLETMGVPVYGYKTQELPGFYTTTSGYYVDCKMDSVEEIAQALKLKWQVGLSGGVIIANPVPEKFALKREDVENVIESAISEMKKSGVTGKACTPFLLKQIHKLTSDQSLKSNIELILNNARLSSKLAKVFYEMDGVLS